RDLVARLSLDPPQEPRPAEGPSEERSQPGRSARGPRTPSLIGRDEELAKLDAAWEGAAHGAGTAIVIRGEAGIGKTRLVRELRERIRRAGGWSATGAALDLGGAAPLSLWAELIRELLPGLPAPPSDAAWPDDLAALANELPAHFGRGGLARPNVAPDLQRARLFEGVVSLIAWAAAQRPLLLVLEDIHAADRPSLELAGYVARRIPVLPVVMLVTRRELPRSGDADQLEQVLRRREVLGGELSLALLGRDRVAEIARQAAGCSDDQAERVADLAEGNPLLAVETARAVAGGSEEVAPSLRGSVRGTLLGLVGEVRRLVELAAIAARPIEPVELDQLELREADESASAAIETGLLITVQRGIGFGHALLREAAYAEIAEPRRRGLHYFWSQALVASERAGSSARPAEVARHLRLAGRDQDAVAELVRAAADARAVAALDQAVDYLVEATSIARGRADLLAELGELEAWRGNPEHAEAAFAAAQVALAAAPPIERARALLRRARANHGPICAPRTVYAYCSEALRLLDTASEPAEAERREALAAVAWAEALDGSLEEAERLLAELVSGATGGDLDTYDVYHPRAFVLMRRGEFADACAAAIAAGEAIDRAGRPDLSYGCWSEAAAAAAAAGEGSRALELIDRGLDALAGKGLHSLEIHLLSARSFILTRLGRFGEARGACQTELELADRIGASALSAVARHDLGLVALEEGSLAEAARLLSGALAQSAPISRPMTRLALAEAYARAGELTRAGDELRATVLEPVRPSDFPEALVPRLARVQGLIASASGDRTQALRRLREAASGWERLLARGGGPTNMATVLADLGRPVVGLVEPARELSRVRADLDALTAVTGEEPTDAVIQ
ncbi:MAG: AAA family ATPase, partial [Actinomycetota bacterium]|nr:AAA family ATPase [Actinomycetota bacterium]